jgi:hypothetical protein
MFYSRKIPFKTRISNFLARKKALKSKGKKKKVVVKENVRELRTKLNRPDQYETPESKELKKERQKLEQDYKAAQKQLDKDVKADKKAKANDAKGKEAPLIR